MMRNGSQLPLRLFLDECIYNRRMTQRTVATLFGKTQAAISQMCRGEREIVVQKEFNEEEQRSYFRLIEIKELGAGTFEKPKVDSVNAFPGL